MGGITGAAMAGGLVLMLLLGASGANAACGILIDPAQPLDRLSPQKFVGETRYTAMRLDGRPVIRAEAADSASGLTVTAPFKLGDCPMLVWEWRVDRVQPGADLRLKALEDFAASIFLVFGEPSLFQRDVPVLVYAWTNRDHAEGEVVASPNMPDNVRTIVLRTGGEGTWARERRDLAADFRAAFGREPPDDVVSTAIFTDNDQTGQPALAYYGAIRTAGR